MFEKQLKIFGKKVVLTMRNEGDYAIASELFLEHQYRFCDNVIQKAQNAIIDIGGHLGFFSLYAGLLNTTVPIYAFEPHAGNFELLKINLKKNHIKNVHPKQNAVGGQIGQVQLQISQEDLNHSTVQALEPTGETQSVHMTTLERIFEKSNIEKCDLIKIDCEGAEYEIIQNTSKDTFGKINHIFMEYHDNQNRNHKKLQQFLQNRGFKVECYPNHKFKNLGFLWCQK